MPGQHGTALGRESLGEATGLCKEGVSCNWCCLPCLNYDFLLVLYRKQNVLNGRLIAYYS